MRTFHNKIIQFVLPSRNTGSEFSFNLHLNKPVVFRILLGLLMLGSTSGVAQTWNWGLNTGQTVFGETSAEKTAVTPGGDVYVVGQKTGSVSFGTTTLESNGLNDVFLAKYSGTGDLLWVQKLGGTRDEAAVALSTDGEGAIVAIRYDSPVITLNGVDYANSGGDSVMPGIGDFSDALVAKADPDGNWLWAMTIGAFGDDEIGDMVTDPNGNLYLAGFLKQSGNIGGLSVSSARSYLLKLDSNRVGQWVIPCGSAGAYPGESYGLAINPQGTELAITGSFAGNAVFGGTTLSGAFGSSDPQAYIASLNALTGQWLWAVQAGGDDTDIGTSVVMDSVGNVTAAGSYYGSHCSIGTFELVHYDSTGSGFGSNSYVARISPTGTVLWAASANSGFQNDITDLELTRDGDVYVAGIAQDTAFFGTNYLSWPYDYNPYIARISGLTGTWQWAIPANEISACGCGHLATTQIDMAVANIGDLYVVSRYTDSARAGNVKLIGPLYFSQGSGQTQGFVLGLGDQMPIVTAVIPASGTVGSGVAITGERLGTANGVKVNGVSASFTVLSPTSIQVTIPPGASSGLIRISTPDGKANSPIVFHVQTPTGLTSPAFSWGVLGPNPAHESVVVTLRPSEVTGTLVMTDALGRTVLLKPLIPGQKQVTLSLAGIRPGVYSIRIGQQTHRLTVQ